MSYRGCRRFLLALLLLVPMVNGVMNAQQTTRGKDFYISFLPNYHRDSFGPSDSLYIYVVADQPTTGVIDYSNGARQYSLNFSIVNPAQIFQFSVPWNSFELVGYNNGFDFDANCDNEIAVNRGFRVRANKDVAVYALNQAVTTSDAALIFPVEALGTEYYVMSYRSDGILTNGGRDLDQNYTPSEFCVVATQDNTTVLVYPTAPTTNSGMQTKQITLNRGQSWMFQTEFSKTNLRYDLTGSRIVSTAPVAVFSGHQRAVLPVESKPNVLSRDHLYEQLPPVNVWGKSYIITPFPRPTGSTLISGANDLYRVVASEDNTVLRFNNVVVATLNRSQVFEAPLVQPGLLVASNKVMVALFKRTHSFSQDLQNGDPFMLIVPPRSQYLSNYRYTNCQVNGAYEDQYITIITSRNNAPSLRFDGQPLVASFVDIPNTCYVYSNVKMAAGAHTIESPRLVGLYIYGFGPAISYGYVGGMAFVPDIDEDNLTAGVDKSICIGDSVDLKATGKAVSLRWIKQNSASRFACDTCPSIRVGPKQTTNYILSGTDSLGCSVLDTVMVLVNQIPDVRAIPDTTVCTDVPVILRAQGQFDQASWWPPTGLSCTICSSTTATPGRDMRYYVKVQNGSSERCTDIDSVTIRYQPGIANAFPRPFNICRGDSAVLKLSYKGRVKWSPAQGLDCDTCKEVIARPLKTTRYSIYADSAQCYSQAVVDVVVSDLPTLSMIHDTIVCTGQTLNLSVKTNAKTVRWFPSTFLSNTNSTNVVVQADSDIRYVVVCDNGAGCITTDSVQVRVRPGPALTVGPKDTTLCDGQRLQIRSALTNVDTISWQPTLGLSCANCPDPIVTVSQNVLYTVTVSNSTGCTQSATVQVRHATLPTLNVLKRDTTMCSGASYQLEARSDTTLRWFPSFGLSCTNCTSPVASPTRTQTYYVVAGDSTGCTVLDSVVVRVQPTPQLQLVIDRDTLCISSGQSRIKVNGGTVGETYQWQTEPGLSCYNCSDPVARPSKSTTYVVRVRNADGCEQSMSVPITVIPCARILEVTDVDLGAMVACDQRDFQLLIQNNGELDLKVDSIYQQSSNGANVIISPTLLLPKILGPSEQSSIALRFVPLRSGMVSTVLALRHDGSWNQSDTLKLVRISAVAEKRPVAVELLSNSTVGQGARFIIPVGLRSDFWSDSKLDAFSMQISYKKVWMQYGDSVSLGSVLRALNWKVDVEPERHLDENSVVRFHASGVKPINMDGIALLPEFKAMLSQDFTFTPQIDSVWFPNQQLCIDASSSSNAIVPEGCAKQIRRVVIGSTPFALQSLNPNPVDNGSLRVEYSVGFSTILQIDICDELGQTRKRLVSGLVDGGDFEFTADLSDLEPGVYFCRYSAANQNFVKSFVVHR